MRVVRRALLRTTVAAGVATALAVTALGGPTEAADRGRARSPVAGLTAQTGAEPAGADGSTPSRLCALPRSKAPNVLTDCERTAGPHGETAIAVNPRDPANFIASDNDTQFTVRNRRLQMGALSRAHVTFDGGRTWASYRLPYSRKCLFTGDPSIAFDERGEAYLATLCAGSRSNPDIVIFRSGDGGRTWSAETAVTRGSSSSGNLVNDHPVLAAWGRRNVAVTWVRYRLAYTGPLLSAPVVVAVSHDGARTFRRSTVVSGHATFCVGLTARHACDQTWGNAVAVGPTTHRLLVTFYNTDRYSVDGSTNLGRSKHMVVELDPATGQRTGGPFLVGQAYDGINARDFPVSAEGRQTLHDSQFRIAMQGNIAADPTDRTGRHFAVVWFDNRNGPRPVSRNPYRAVTNSDIIVSQTRDGGRSWSTPQAIPERNDQFFPWAAYDVTGRLRVGFFDRAYDPANHRYGYTVATETRPGALRFQLRQVTTALSDPTRHNRWFTVSVDRRFPGATTFIGDYSAIATTPTGVVSFWTDLRRRSCVLSRCGHGQNTFAAVTG